MANKNVSSLTLATSLGGSELVHISQSGLSYQETLKRMNKSGVMGALLRITSNRASQDYTLEPMISWDSAVYDTHGFWSASSATILKVPDGIRAKYVKLSSNIGLVSVTSGNWIGNVIKHRNNTDLSQTANYGIYIPQTQAYMDAHTAPLQHTDGTSHYYECAVKVSLDTSVQLQADDSFFSITVVGVE